MSAPSPDTERATSRAALAREALAREAERAVRSARRSGRRRWLAWRRPVAETDSLDAVAAAQRDGGDEDVFCYEVPEERFALAAVGAAARLEAAGPGRFAALDARRRALAGDLHVAGDAPPEAGPLLVGGAAFRDADPDPTCAPEWEGFPAAGWVLPRRLHVRHGDRAWSCAVGDVGPDDDPEAVARRLAAATAPGRAPAPAGGEAPGVRLEPVGGAAGHRERVGRALAAIHAGELEKVVVARALDVVRDAPFDALALLRTLRALHPACASFAIRRGGAWLVGASPERLLRCRAREARAVALAGSAPRGRTPGEDARLRRELVESKKEQAEHAVVVRALRRGLEPLCASLRVPEAPRVLALGGVQHLRTLLAGRLHEPRGLLELAARVHPTPAVAGAPSAAALAWLGRHEDLERGWYAGLVGWMTPEGDGELSAALRCALLRGGRARLFAGGGIVAGSDPEAELAETRLKWNALLPALLEL